MRPGFLTRRAIQLAATANALRPLPGADLAAIPAFFGAWLTGELAPHFLALTVADTLAHLARDGAPRSPSDRVAVGLAALSAAGLGALIVDSQRARGAVERALAEALGPRYVEGLARRPDPTDLATPWGQLVWPFRMRDKEVRRDRDIAYAPGGRRFHLDLYRPVEPVRDRPVLLQIHGGAWMVDSKDHQGIPLMLQMARRGWVCVAINYPLSPAARWPAHIAAVKQAVAWIRDDIADYGGDPAFLAVTGGSAGGHLAALLALMPDTGVRACVPHYGVYDFAASSGAPSTTRRLKGLLARYVVGKDPVAFRDDYIAASPLEQVNDKAPPFFVVHGERDTVVPVSEAREFVRRLRQVSSNPVAYAEIPGAEHAFDVFPSIRSAHVARGVERFLEWSYLRYLQS